MAQREAAAVNEAECRRPANQLLRPACWSLLLMVPALCLAGCGEKQEAEAQTWDCQDGFSNWQLGWSSLKIDWCCKNKQVACHSTSAPFDCKAGAQNWQKAWSEKKKTWCCTYFVVGCSTYPGNATGSLKDAGSDDTETTKSPSITSTVLQNAGDFVTDECWSKHQAMSGEAQNDPSPKNCAAFHAKLCTWQQGGSKEKMCFPKVCVAKHLEQEIADKGRAEVNDFACHEDSSS
eukprot:TRINITY_DN13980_c0_g1_i1.p1 TRINITY_DN13980_c0_g1~~TRINITY_DN13980_c0_g1_i1.p1  ORF type:complete len:250 (+),score=60.21 TRINITY_DN13980_c0_g1_i1:51-752(+)